MNSFMRTSRKWVRPALPALLILLWLAAAGVGGPTFGKISQVSSNDQAAFLPASAESTAVQEWQHRFVDSSTVPAVVLVTAKSRPTDGELEVLAALPRTMGAVAGVPQGAAGATTGIAGPIPSQDGLAVEYIVPVADAGDLKTVVDGLRKVLAANVPDGMSYYVTGPAGLGADLVGAFAGIDGVLLLVALLAVFVILLLVYRSVVLPVLVLFTSVAALCAAIVVVYYMARWGWIKLSGQSQGILSILVIGAATDYSLLLVARFREALHHVESARAALGRALRGAWEPITASATTVILALLCLLFSELNSNRSLGPIAAIGIFFSLVAALTCLPALLAVFGRAAFWPFRPRLDTATAHSIAPGIPGVPGPGDATAGRGLDGVTGLWRRISLVIARRPRLTWVLSLALLVVASGGILQLQAHGVSQTQVILGPSNAVDGQAALAQHFNAGSGSPVVVIADQAKAAQVVSAVESSGGIADAAVYTGNSRPGPDSVPVARDGRVMVNATLKDQADSDAAERVVVALRRDLPAVDAGVLVGGVSAIALDTNVTAQHDLATIIPLVLAVILVVLMVLLRSILAPLVLIGSVVLSYTATMGVSAVVFNHIFGFPGADATVPLFGFVFLVALGVDYNIFLMTRVREEAQLLGTRAGVLRGLGKTGGVITSAGVVLAATFAALGVIPLLFLAQLAFIVAFGVLLDTTLVRSLLVPALSYDLGARIWWPGAAGKRHGKSV
ncbi:MMPL family transporter [Arthrobacter sp. SDTb3-6]|uniref:MMPL family transporter n=1 Tax=Arthrobacter sp. SDTb3-6 TaxID=2713571 RepID=UPI00210E57B2|nr:MMPL family transporter [Arthrobacter sp. SDTb3-6]